MKGYEAGSSCEEAHQISEFCKEEWAKIPPSWCVGLIKLSETLEVASAQENTLLSESKGSNIFAHTNM